MFDPPPHRPDPNPTRPYLVVFAAFPTEARAGPGEAGAAVQGNGRGDTAGVSVTATLPRQHPSSPPPFSPLHSLPLYFGLIMDGASSILKHVNQFCLESLLGSSKEKCTAHFWVVLKHLQVNPSTHKMLFIYLFIY